MEDPPLHLEAAARLPELIRFGTSSWVYPGWKGLVYRAEYKNDKDFRARCLEEYARFPWFRTVGMDFPYYGPARADQLRRYAAQLPEEFPWVSKVWQELTIARFPDSKRHKERAGQDNPNFLDAALFRKQVLPAHLTEEARPHNGPFVLQFQPGLLRALPADDFLEKLRAFFQAVPEELFFAVEVRDEPLLTPDYFAVLNAHGATHVFNHWSWMPPLIDQMKRAADAGGLQAPFYVARLLTPRHVAYASAVKRFQPYEKLQAPIESMRDDVVRLARRALLRGSPTFILVNNRSEGSAPRTIDEIGARIVEGTPGQSER